MDWTPRAPDSRWVLMACLLDVHSKMSFGSTRNAQMRGYLFDQKKPNSFSGAGVWDEPDWRSCVEADSPWLVTMRALIDAHSDDASIDDQCCQTGA